MNENIDLTKILNGCPEGVKFYSPLFGEVEFVEISKVFRNSIVTRLKGKDIAYFSKDGQYFGIYEDAECLLLPSKVQRDWSKFERFWDKPKVEKFDPNTLRPYDKVLARGIGETWKALHFSHKSREGYVSPWCCSGYFYDYCIPYNDDTKHLVNTTDEAPEYYRWWEE